jgi:hypothetical protein
MNRTEIEQTFDPKTFSPVVITTIDGFAIPVPYSHYVLVGLGMIVVKGPASKLYQIPFRSIAHISEAGEHLG